MILNPKIFRAYDIRGEAFVDFDEDGFYLIAEAYGRYIAKKFDIDCPKIFVSGDGRLSMPQLFPAVLSGLTASGAEVTWGGTLPTPINFFALHEGKFDATIQISASHNPAPDNGLKLTDRNGAVCGGEIQKIKVLSGCSDRSDADCVEEVRQGKKHLALKTLYKNIGDARLPKEALAVRLSKTTPTSPNSTHSLSNTDNSVKKPFGVCVNACEKVDFSIDYKTKIKTITPKQKPLKVVVDAGNGVAGMFYPGILRSMGHEVTEIFCDLDGSFPNHQPDPERPENLVFTQKKLKEQRADLAFVYDGDGDRVGIVLNNGMILNADKIMYILASDFLSRNAGAKIVVDAMTSATLITKIKAMGGVPILTQTGHSFIEEAMHKHKALLGGEQSGHFMFGEDFYGHDDACLASLRFIKAIESDSGLLKAVTTAWPNLLEFSEKITVDDEKKFKVLSAVTDKLTKIDGSPLLEKAVVNTIDGVRLDWPDGEWAIIRCSNTSPKIALRIEAKDEASLQAKKTGLMNVLQTCLEDF